MGRCSPEYGHKKIVPEAVFDDGFLYLHLDGNIARKGDAFRFQVLPGALRMWC